MHALGIQPAGAVAQLYALPSQPRTLSVNEMHTGHTCSLRSTLCTWLQTRVRIDFGARPCRSFQSAMFQGLTEHVRTQFSRDGHSLSFLYNVGRCQKLDEQRWTYQFTAAVDGSGLWRVPVVAGARHSFGRGGRLLICDGTGYYEVLDRREVHRLELPSSGERVYDLSGCMALRSFIPICTSAVTLHADCT